MTRVLVTGAGGFIGSHVCEALAEAGASLRAFVRYSSHGGAGWLERSPLSAEIDIARGDVRDPSTVLAAMHGVEVVVHLAALIGIPYSYVAPEAYLDVNARGALHVLQAARAAGVRRIVIASTSEVYGSARQVPIDESHPLQAQSPYAASKIAADSLAESFALSFGLEVVTLRPFNTYGPRQSARAVIPAIITQLMAGDVLALGNVEPRRDFTFVEDVARAFVAAATSDGLAGETLNVASGRDVAIDELAAMLMRRMRPARLVHDPARARPRGSEVDRLLGSSERLTALTGWRPRVPLEEGLDRTIAWFAETANGARARGYEL